MILHIAMAILFFLESYSAYRASDMTMFIPALIWGIGWTIASVLYYKTEH